MANIQAPATLVADTGTGVLWVPYRMNGDEAVYVESAPSAQPAYLTQSRTEPKPARDFPGTRRASLKTQRAYADTTGVLRTATLETHSALPMTITDAEKLAFVQAHLLAVGLSVSVDLLAKAIVQQS